MGWKVIQAKFYGSYKSRGFLISRCWKFIAEKVTTCTYPKDERPRKCLDEYLEVYASLPNELYLAACQTSTWRNPKPIFVNFLFLLLVCLLPLVLFIVCSRLFIVFPCLLLLVYCSWLYHNFSLDPQRGTEFCNMFSLFSLVPLIFSGLAF